jgi:acyl-coenzyme A thioesterase 7
MQLVEQAGADFSREYCQSFQTKCSELVTTMTGCFEKADFASPMFDGEICEVYAELGYTSPHSLQVLLKLLAHADGEEDKRLVMRAKIWYVPVLLLSKEFSEKSNVISVSAHTRHTNVSYRDGQSSYERLKRFRNRLALQPGHESTSSVSLARLYSGEESHTVAHSRTQMMRQIVLSDCWPGQTYCRGAVALKLIDDCGVVAAIKHCNYFCATVGVENTIFHKKIELGSLLVATARLIFTSSKTAEVKVDVDEVRLARGEGLQPLKQRAVESVLTCLALDDNFQPRDMKPLIVKNDEENQLLIERKRIYDKKKKEKLANKLESTQ